MTFDVVITTYNRSENVINLCNEILQCSVRPQKLIVIDSSDKNNGYLESLNNLIYKKSSHKSQPYQRYLGYLISEADIIVYFDDDLTIKDYTLFETIVNCFEEDPKLIGLSLGIDYKNGISERLEKSTISPIKTIALKLKKEKPLGAINRFGVTNILARKDFYTNFLPGPNMCFRRNVLDGVFDDQLFALFEKRLGMGEDKVISMRVSKKGKMLYKGSNIFLEHPPIASTYFTDETEFRAKVIYSRIWLAHQYNKLWSSRLNNCKIIFYLLKCFLLSLQSKTMLNAFFLSFKYIFKYGFYQNKLGLNHINYQEDLTKDAK